MKKILYTLLLLSVFACGKDEIGNDKVIIDEYYVITDDPQDAVQHKRYELYSTYGVSIFFNDTIGQGYVKDDASGNPYYQTELIDFAWNFSSSNNNRYFYSYMKDQVKQMQSLDVIDSYLSTTPKTLLPFSILVVDSLYYVSQKLDTTYKNTPSYLYGFRSAIFVMPEIWDQQALESTKSKLTQTILNKKIANYANQTSAFNNVSTKEWYNKMWVSLSGYDSSLPTLYYGSSSWLTDTADWFHQTTVIWGWDRPRAESTLTSMRNYCGKFGFIGGNSIYTPENYNDDQKLYLTEMFKYPKREFEEIWADCPLVLKKYKILYDVVTNYIGVDFE